MSHKPASILLVEDDDDVADVITDYVEQTLKARVKRVTTASDAICNTMAEDHDVVLADLSLPDCDDLELARELQRDGDFEIILMTSDPTVNRALEAMRLGIRDMLPKPFDLHLLGESLEGAVATRRKRSRERLRNERLRRVSARIIRERRVLRQRVDLVCRDLVSAYRRLAEKVVESRQA